MSLQRWLVVSCATGTGDTVLVMGWAGKHTGWCLLPVLLGLGVPFVLLPIFRAPSSPGVAEHVTRLHQTPASLQTAMGITREREQAKRSRKHQEKVPTPCFGTSCTSLCQLAGATSQAIKPKEPASARPGPDPAPAARESLAMPSSCTKKSKSSVSSSAYGRGRTHTSSPQALYSRHLYSSVQSCPSVPPRHTDGFSPKSHQAPSLCLSPGQGLRQKAIIATKRGKTLRSGQGRQRKMLRWVAFFQLIFFFFMKKDHTEFSNKQNAKKIVLNKT